MTMLRLGSLLSLLLLHRRISAFTVSRPRVDCRGLTSIGGTAPSPFYLRSLLVDDDVYVSELERELGVKDGKLALGVDPNEVLKYIGRREDLIEKTMQDIPSFNRAKAEEEVDKFLQDQEAVQMYINFGKAKEGDPDFVVPTAKDEEEGLFSFKNIVFGYVGYVFVTSVAPKFFRKWVGQQQEAGTWTGTGIAAVDDWIAKTPIPAPPSQVAVDVVSSSSSVSDAVSAGASSAVPAVVVESVAPAAAATAAIQAAAADVAATVTEAAAQVSSSSEAGQSLFDVASGVFQ